MKRILIQKGRISESKIDDLRKYSIFEESNIHIVVEVPEDEVEEVARQYDGLLDMSE